MACPRDALLKHSFYVFRNFLNETCELYVSVENRTIRSVSVQFERSKSNDAIHKKAFLYNVASGRAGKHAMQLAVMNALIAPEWCLTEMSSSLILLRTAA